MNDALSGINLRNARTPQSEQADARQVQNNAGGFTFEVSAEDRIMRFLMLGTDGGTFYVKQKDLTKDNAKSVVDFATANGVRLVEILREVSVAGRAPRQNGTMFALAAVFTFGNAEAKQAAEAAFNDIVRTGEHLFMFVAYLENQRGWGRGIKRAVANWYESKDARQLSYQMVKYRQRHDWTHADVLRSAHAIPGDVAHNALYGWTADNPRTTELTASARKRVLTDTWVEPFRIAKSLEASPPDGPRRKTVFADLVREYPGLPWEALPDVALTYPETWEAILDAGMPTGALLRNLSKLTAHGVLTGERLSAVKAQLTDPDVLRKARIHPVKVLYALRTYASNGAGSRGKLTWTPIRSLTDTLDAMFYASFGTIEPANKRTLVALDVSGSMTWETSKCGILTAREGSAAMAMATLASEPDSEVVAFASGSMNEYYSTPRGPRNDMGITPVDLTPRRRLDDNIRTISDLWAGGTDCALPMIWAEKERKAFDTFVVYTDNETWAGQMHPHEALRDYRRKTGIAAKLVVVGMASTGFTIADPSDKGMLDVAGFDADTPQIISAFSRGDLG
jgi:60 kDa SS-A/Ro ribonucleoprotein